MTFEIRTPDGRILTVSTEVGDGLSRVVVTEAVETVVSIDGEDQAN